MKCLLNKINIFTIVVSLATIISAVSSNQDKGEYLDSLGRSLKNRLENPGKGSEDLMKDLFDYYNNLEEIHTNITSNDKLLKKEGLDLVQGLIEDGGPPHLNVEVDFDKFLFKVFKNDRDTQMIDRVLKDNRKIWEKLKALYEKHAHI
ncbi:hypothetical protein J6590_058637 [Homalodisca vitripennis]|nr:hypothetical protein J6590_093998 [Homalodisca vitripennis]KAG8335855.1 hypothetical protein J6590_058637 [Homalodisca vitripennis]